MPKYDARQQIEEIKEKLARIQVLLDDLLKNHVPHIQEELKRISGRPSWTVSGIITILFSLVSLLLSIVLRR